MSAAGSVASAGGACALLRHIDISEERYSGDLELNPIASITELKYLLVELLTVQLIHSFALLVVWSRVYQHFLK